MKYNIHVTQAAERDMANAYDYIDLVLKKSNCRRQAVGCSR